MNEERKAEKTLKTLQKIYEVSGSALLCYIGTL